MTFHSGFHAGTIGRLLACLNVGRSAMKRCILVLALFNFWVRGDDIDVEEIVRRAANAMQADWSAAPGFAFVQRDVTTSKGIVTTKTQQVFIVQGSDYYMPIAVDDKPLSADQQKLELQRLRDEVARRSHETPQEARQRAEQYRKIREQNGILLEEFTKALDFTLAGDETIDGHACYVFEAKPKPGYRPSNRTAKVLAGMQGRLWIDKKSFHWLRAEAEALKPVSVFGLFARVLPGTRMELNMTPVTDSIWLVSRIAVDMRLSILWRKSTKETETTFNGYRPASAVLAEALANEKDEP
jgi:hypothetical protein